VSKLAITAPSSAITSDPRSFMACPRCGPAAHCYSALLLLMARILEGSSVFAPEKRGSM
jgi:hypothetical protein